MSKQYCLVNLISHSVAKDRRGRPILTDGPPGELPAGFSRREGFSFEEVHTVIDRNHTGRAKYVMSQPQSGIVSKIVAPPKA